MIYVDGVLFPDKNSSLLSLLHRRQCSSSLTNLYSLVLTKNMIFLLEQRTHPVIISASESFKNLEEQKVTESSTKDRYVYILLREYAVVDPALVDVCLLLHLKVMFFFLNPP